MMECYCVFILHIFNNLLFKTVVYSHKLGDKLEIYNVNQIC